MASQENVVLPNQHLEDVVAWLQQMIKSGENILDLLQGLQDGEGREIEKIQLPIESLNIFRAPLSHTNIIMNEKSKQSEAFGVKLPRGIKVLKEPCIQIEDENNTQEENKDAQINDIETITMLFCTHCDFKTTYENQLSKHEIKRHDMLRQCDECDYKTCSKKVFEKHKLKQHGKPLECDKCAFQTNVPKQFRGHQLYRHGKISESHRPGGHITSLALPPGNLYNTPLSPPAGIFKTHHCHLLQVDLQHITVTSCRYLYNTSLSPPAGIFTSHRCHLLQVDLQHITVTSYRYPTGISHLNHVCV